MSRGSWFVSSILALVAPSRGADAHRRRRGPVVAAFGLRIAVAGLVACAPVENAEAPADAAEEARARAAAAADSLGARLVGELGARLETGPPAEAIAVCSEIAPAAAAELSRGGLRIRRTSLRTRNPANAPDAWEAARLRGLEEAVARGEAPRELHEVDSAAGELRYLRPIVVGEVCLACHGAAEELAPEVVDRVAELYPEDRATGYSAGDLRGAFSVRVALGQTGS